MAATARTACWRTCSLTWGVETGHAITVFHSVEPLPHRAAAFADPAVVHGYYKDDARMVLDPVRDLLTKHGIQALFEHRISRAGVEIAAFAEKGGFDLLVMGSRGRGVWVGLVLGSVATKVLAACTVPVLLGTNRLSTAR